MENMKRIALAACLLAPASLPFVYAETPASPQEAALPLAERLRAQLDAMEQANSQDFYEAAKLVLAETGDPTAFYPLMEAASGAGSAAATLWLAPLDIARMKMEGAPLEASPRAVELHARVKAAAEKGYRPALVLASRLAASGIGAAADMPAATRYLVEGSKQGCQQARAGYLVLTGRLQKGGVEEPAVAAELARNNFYLEEIIAHGMGDTVEGVHWLRRATEHGSALAPYLLTQSRSAALSERESMEMLALAAGRHHVDAMDFLGNIRLRANDLSASTGLTVEEDIEGGLELLRLAAALGQPEAAQSLATALAQGQGTKEAGAKVPVAQICALYRMAAEMGDPQGMAGYGYCLMAGLGCKADAGRGEALLNRAVEKGAQWASLALASAYYNGFGVKPDMRRAVNALGESAAMGSAHAYTVMAAITALGNEGTAPDLARARIYLDMAVAEDEADARGVYQTLMDSRGWRFLPLLWQ